MSVKDDLAGVLADSLNKKFKDYKVAYFLDGAQETPTDIKEFKNTHRSYRKRCLPSSTLRAFIVAPSDSWLCNRNLYGFKQ